MLRRCSVGISVRTCKHPVQDRAPFLQKSIIQNNDGIHLLGHKSIDSLKLDPISLLRFFRIFAVKIFSRQRQGYVAYNKGNHAIKGDGKGNWYMRLWRGACRKRHLQKRHVRLRFVL